MSEKYSSSIVVGNRTGGQGKTLTSQIIYLLFKNNNILLDVYSADTEENKLDLNNVNKSKLSRILKDANVKEFGIGSNISDVRSDSDSIFTNWDNFGETIYNGNSLVDLGANVFPFIKEWSRDRDATSILADGAPIDFVIPVTAQVQSLVDALSIIEDLKMKVLPIRMIYVVWNEVHGKFDNLTSNSEFKKIKKVENSGLLKSISLSRCSADFWSGADSRFISIEELVDMSKNGKIISEFNYSRFKANSHIKQFSEWVSENLDNFYNSGLISENVNSVSLS